jgi:EF hand
MRVPRRFTLSAVLSASVALLTACADDGPPPEPRVPPKVFHPVVEMLERYDANHDGTVTREEMEAGLKAEFDAADKKHNGCLDADETDAVNEARWAEGLSTTSTLVDWNHDGCVDFKEFANTTRSLFDEIDRKNTGKLTPQMLHPEKYPKGKKPPESAAPPTPPPQGGGN